MQLCEREREKEEREEREREIREIDREEKEREDMCECVLERKRENARVRVLCVRARGIEEKINKLGKAKRKCWMQTWDMKVNKRRESSERLM